MLRIKRAMNREFPGKLRVRYVDVESAAMDPFPAIRSRILRNPKMLPLAFFEGRIIQEGALSVRRLLRLLREEMSKE